MCIFLINGCLRSVQDVVSIIKQPSILFRFPLHPEFFIPLQFELFAILFLLVLHSNKFSTQEGAEFVGRNEAFMGFSSSVIIFCRGGGILAEHLRRQSNRVFMLERSTPCSISADRTGTAFALMLSNAFSQSTLVQTRGSSHSRKTSSCCSNVIQEAKSLFTACFRDMIINANILQNLFKERTLSKLRSILRQLFVVRITMREMKSFSSTVICEKYVQFAAPS